MLKRYTHLKNLNYLFLKQTIKKALVGSHQSLILLSPSNPNSTINAQPAKQGTIVLVKKSVGNSKPSSSCNKKHCEYFNVLSFGEKT